MSLRNPYLLSIIIATIFGWISWGLVLEKMSPFISGYLALGLFYASLTVALSGTFALLFYYGKLWRNPTDAPTPYLNTALRQGFLLSLMITIGLIFQRLRVLTWWDALLLLAIVCLIEFYILTKD